MSSARDKILAQASHWRERAEEADRHTVRPPHEGLAPDASAFARGIYTGWREACLLHAEQLEALAEALR